jgi:predicted alpha/beta superfamily hydrolase
MLRFFFFFSLVCCLVRLYAQQANYLPAQNKQVLSQKLGQPVDLEIILPDTSFSPNAQQFPVIYLFDSQNKINYAYNLHTIQYLTDLGEMPPCIVIGIPFDYSVRNDWTDPNQTGGKADDFIAFLTDELAPMLVTDYGAAPLQILVGHSRTAILASYAMSVAPDNFQAVICSSSAYFDFGSEHQKMQFEKFLTEITSSDKQYHYYFSSGFEKHGDPHENSVNEMAYYLKTHPSLPDNFQWDFLIGRAGHYSTPGFTVNPALLDLFSPYNRALQRCFHLLEDSVVANRVPLDQFQEIYSQSSVELGYVLKPDLLFYNSIASAYYNDYQNDFGEKNVGYCLKILLNAIQDYPDSYEFYAWIGELYFELNQKDNAWQSLSIAEELVKESTNLSKTEKKEWYTYLDVIRATYK